MQGIFKLIAALLGTTAIRMLVSTSCLEFPMPFKLRRFLFESCRPPGGEFPRLVFRSPTHQARGNNKLRRKKINRNKNTDSVYREQKNLRMRHETPYLIFYFILFSRLGISAIRFLAHLWWCSRYEIALWEAKLNVYVVHVDVKKYVPRISWYKVIWCPECRGARTLNSSKRTQAALA